MRLFRLLIALACLVAGIAVGGLNTQAVQLDLGFAQLPTSLGVAVLVALLLGGERQDWGYRHRDGVQRREGGRLHRPRRRLG